MQNSNLEILEEIFKEVFELQDTSEHSEITQEKIKKWDSLAHISLIVAVESEFDISIDAADYELFTSFLSVKSILEGLKL